MTDRPYDAEFFRILEDRSAASAEVVLPLLIQWLDPRSLVDVGCGTGTWAAVALAEGVPDVVGIDGDYVDRAQLRIPDNAFLAADLSEPFGLPRRFDIAICLEVAEHLSAARGPGFIGDLCRLSDVIAFSAAIPGQEGTNHVNPRWPSYWVSLFKSHGYETVDVIRPRVWRDERVAWWYRQNILVAAKSPLPQMSGSSREPLIDCVHPAHWERHLARHLAPIGIRQLLRSAWPALATSVKHRLPHRLTKKPPTSPPP